MEHEETTPSVAYELRRRILDFWWSAAGQEVTLRMRESTLSRGAIAAVDAAQSMLHVRQLETPIGTYPCATVRATDVLAVEFERPWLLECPLPPPPPPDSGGHTAWVRAAAAAVCPPAASEAPADEARSSAVAPAVACRLLACRGACHEQWDGRRRESIEAAVRPVSRSLPCGPTPPSLAPARTPHPHTSSLVRSRVEAGPAATASPLSLSAAALPRRRRETHKYWKQRYHLFKSFDKGVLLDREGWFSVTPQAQPLD